MFLRYQKTIEPIAVIVKNERVKSVQLWKKFRRAEFKMKELKNEEMKKLLEKFRQAELWKRISDKLHYYKQIKLIAKKDVQMNN